MWGWDQWHNGPIRGFKARHSNIGILLGNRQISREALNILYSKTTFHFDDIPSLNAFVTATPDTSLAVMTNLTLTLTFQRPEIITLNWTYQLSICLGKMQSLRFLDLSIWSSGLGPSNPRQRRTKCVGDYKQSALLPRLERGLVIFTGDKSFTRRDTIDTITISPLELCYEIAGLIKGVPETHS